jgi:hypothetical protein
MARMGEKFAVKYVQLRFIVDGCCAEQSFLQKALLSTAGMLHHHVIDVAVTPVLASLE